MNRGFQQTLERIRADAQSQSQKGAMFERLMRAYFGQDPVYVGRFSRVWLWAEWAFERDEFDANDIGIDLVAEERAGGYCAIQCKCYAPGTRIAKPDLDSFIAASARDPFTARLVVDTGDGWGPNARKTIDGLKPPCGVLRYNDLAERPIDWPDLLRGEPEDLRLRRKAFALRPHQQAALADVLGGFRQHDRGKLVMACGTGKTFTALRIAEALAGDGGRVLYLLPSISLFQQSMREWAEQRALAHRYIGICSDASAGKSGEDAAFQELEIPVTTNAAAVSATLRHAPADALTVVFCTYHSLGLVEQAQAEGAPPFDLALCDEAHRTTGVERPGDKTSPFVLVHDKKRVRAGKRLYMTATPRLYTEGARAKAARHEVEVFSMDDEAVYGPEFHRLPFSRAVEQGLLSDYKVAVLALSEQHVDKTLQEHLAEDGGGGEAGDIAITDAAKIVGCWRALQDPENRRRGNGSGGEPPRPLRRAIAFSSTIAASKRLTAHWAKLVKRAAAQLPADERAAAAACETRHIDGQDHALERKQHIEWLKEGSGETCRILSNARCLSEGIDVPALDAVLFMSPRNSQVDIVQAVGRAMRKAEGKRYGYIVLPIAVPPNADPAAELDNNERFAAVWSVLRALRSHDDRFDAEINRIDLNDKAPERILVNWDVDGNLDLPFPPLDLPPEAICAKIVEKCGDRKYWETWAGDVADIFARLVGRIEGLLRNSAALRRRFEAFHRELTVSINDSVGRHQAVAMIAQHVLTRPVFEALFEHYDFAGHNPVARALDALRGDFEKSGLQNETRDLERFYESVRRRAQGLDNSAARQRVLMELYEKFFAIALRKEADRLGIVYTPVEVVDFILHSADRVLRQEFGRGLGGEGVHVLDPFAGTGIFLARLLQSGLIADADLARKYKDELHANEIVLLAYYIAAVHIEEAFHGRSEKEYEPFKGIVLTDTFNLHTGKSGFPREWLPVNSERAEQQQKLPIEVVVGNPPWSTGQRSSADDNPNVDYPELEQRVSETYAVRSKVTLKRSLYDTYKMAIRWASDRIGKQGVIGVVTNGSWIDGNADAGVRACLAEEFTSVYVLNLRGNQRTQGERSRREGGKIFGQGSRAPVAVTILAKNPKAKGCRILYRDIGDYLTREQKLALLRETESIAGIHDWQEIKPDKHYDWLGQRSGDFQRFFPIGSKDVKMGRGGEAIFELFSRGYITGRDAYTYNFSRDVCAQNGSGMVDDYTGALLKLCNGEGHFEEITSKFSKKIRWDENLKNNLKRKKGIVYNSKNIYKTQYRPFTKQYCYIEYILANSKYQLDKIFPKRINGNRAICVPGIGSTKPFSALMVDSMPDIQLIMNGQCFPRYRYQLPDTARPALPGMKQRKPERIDNITDAALRAFRKHYNDDGIDKDAIFDYAYGLLHAPAYRERFANDLAKELPRIPFAPDFRAFARAGRKLAKLHLGYETCAEYPLTLDFAGAGKPRKQHFRIGARKMRLIDDKTALRINEHVTLRGIPAEAHEYVVNGRTPLEWFIDRYRIVQDKHSGIVNDPNGWFEDPRDLAAAVRRIVHLSKETARIVKTLPAPFAP